MRLPVRVTGSVASLQDSEVRALRTTRLSLGNHDGEIVLRL